MSRRNNSRLNWSRRNGNRWNRSRQTRMLPNFASVTRPFSWWARGYQPFCSCSKIRLFPEVYLHTPACVWTSRIMAVRTQFSPLFVQLKFGHAQFQLNSRFTDRPLWTCAWSIYQFTKCCRPSSLSVNAFVQTYRHHCANNGQYKLGEKLFIHPSFKTLLATQACKLCSDVKFDFVRELHATTIPPPL